jgi:hypothetical protein
MNGLFKHIRRRIIVGIAALIFCALIPATSFGADVDVYAEGAYTDTDLVLYIYADITQPILSFGVKVNYPGNLTYSSATKNEDVWYFGDGSTNHPYMDPEVEDSGVVIIGGKLDTGAPTAGVTGTRVLLGTVTFTHSGITDFSGVTLTYGRGDGTGDYKNFVATDGTVKDGTADGVGFAVEIHERGDANGDGSISTADYIMIRNNIDSSEAPLWIDCNDDGDISTADYICVRNKF